MPEYLTPESVNVVRERIRCCGAGVFSLVGLLKIRMAGCKWLLVVKCCLEEEKDHELQAKAAACLMRQLSESVCASCQHFLFTKSTCPKFCGEQFSISAYMCI
jgi:hypothetical protein